MLWKTADENPIIRLTPQVELCNYPRKLPGLVHPNGAHIPVPWTGRAPDGGEDVFAEQVRISEEHKNARLSHTLVPP